MSSTLLYGPPPNCKRNRFRREQSVKMCPDCAAGADSWAKWVRSGWSLTLLQLTVGSDPDSWWAGCMLRSAASPATTEYQTPGHNPQSSVSPKPLSVLVTCGNCAHENFPQRRYCGMCGAALRLPLHGAAGSTSGGPSPLGFTEVHTEDADASYFLKDDQIPRRWG